MDLEELDELADRICYHVLKWSLFFGTMGLALGILRLLKVLP